MLTAYQFALIVAAPIAAALAIFGVVVVRGTKITEFRQAWINAQRDDLAIMVSAVRRIARNLPGDKLADAWSAFDLSVTRIRLRRNPKVRWLRSLASSNRLEWADVLTRIDALEAALNATPIVRAETERAVTDIVDRSVHYLKREWNRTRDGETGFKLYVLFAPMLIGGTLLVTFGWIVDRAFGLGWTEGLSFTDTLPVPPK